MSHTADSTDARIQAVLYRALTIRGIELLQRLQNYNSGLEICPAETPLLLKFWLKFSPPDFIQRFV
jgi:hypothetical protein